MRRFGGVRVLLVFQSPHHLTADILHQRSTSGDGEGLMPATNSQHRHPVFETLRGDGQLHHRPILLHPVEPSLGLLPVMSRVNIKMTPGKHHAVRHLQQPLHIALPGRDEQGNPTFRTDSLDDSLRDVGLSPLGAYPWMGGARAPVATIGGDQDDWTHSQTLRPENQRCTLSATPRLSLARIPTPIHRLDRLSEHVGAEVWIKRDDLTGFGLSGNKVRKLEMLMHQAQAMQATDILTTGGLQSNHCRATAVASRQLGMQPHLLLRGELPPVADSNLLLDQLLGASIRTCTADDYRHARNELLHQWAEELRGRGRTPFVIPEGGSNAVGSAAYVHAAAEVKGPDYPAFDHIIVAVGSGGTLAGLAHGDLAGFVHGVAVCDDAPTFEGRVHDITHEPEWEFGRRSPGDGWEVTEGFQGPAYAVATPQNWDVIRTVARLEGLFLDPVYTGKAMTAVFDETSAGRWGGRILFWHTGGAFGLFGRGEELTR